MKLLNKSFKPFAIFTVLIVLISIPAYYYVIQKIYLNDADESLHINKAKIQDRINKLTKGENDALEIIEILNSMNIGISINRAEKNAALLEERIYTIERFDPYHNHIEPFRILESTIQIHDIQYEIKLEADLDEFNDVIPYTASIAGIFFILILTGYYWVNKRVSEKTWQPFLQTIQSLENFSISSDRPLPEIKSDVEEFKKLSNILQNYNQKNRAIYLQQKTFIENASHELQTPLMILHAKTDSLMQSEAINESQLSILDEMKQIVGRMSKINRNLLLLAKIENHQFDIQGKIYLNDSLEKELDFFSDLIINKNIQIEKQFESKLILEANQTLIEMLLNNLLRNAIKYNTNPGKIIVETRHKELIISNASEEGELDHQKLFQRFYKSANSHNSSGLGLSICMEICKIHHWKINYGYKNNLHQFSVKF